MARPVKKVKFQECLEILHQEFKKINDPRAYSHISMNDILMSSFAIFNLKYPSLLKFEESTKLTPKKENLRSVFGIESIPSDTQLRDVIDLIQWSEFRPIFKKLFSVAQRSKLLEKYEFMRFQNEPLYLWACDGTGYFRSDKVGCSNCNNYDKGEKKKNKKYGHNILGTSLVHPDMKQVITVCPEPIISTDGSNKNDCELNAFKRFIPKFRKEHPKIGAIFCLDALYASEPAIKLLFENDCHFITAVKETQSALFRQVNEGDTKEHEYTYEIGDKVKKQVIHRYRYAENFHLNQDPRSTRVNFLEFWEEINWEGKRGPETKRVHFAWITDLPVNKDTIVKLVKGGRSRWKIENETFNTLKNQGYNIEHNYGHGKENLSVNFILMMFISFLIDQIQEASCLSFKKALDNAGARYGLWEKMRVHFVSYIYDSIEAYIKHLSGDIKFIQKISLNSS